VKYFYIILLVIVSNQASALDCQKAITTPDINDCGRIELNKMEVQLNLAFQRTLKAIDIIRQEPSTANKTDLKKKLIEAQRLWIKFRQVDCQATYILWSDGTIRGSMYMACMYARAEQRIKELKEYETAYD